MMILVKRMEVSPEVVRMFDLVKTFFIGHCNVLRATNDGPETRPVLFGYRWSWRSIYRTGTLAWISAGTDVDERATFTCSGGKVNNTSSSKRFIEMIHVARCLQTIAATTLLAGHAFAREQAQPPEHDLATFEHWVVDNLYCRADFMEKVQTPAFWRQVKSLGVKVTTDWQEGDIPEGDFVLPQPITVGGQQATQIRYWGDSGAEFYAKVAARAETLVKALGAKPIPKSMKKDFDEKTKGVIFTRAAHADERLAPMMFVRESDTSGVSEVGCRYFDG
jgi:hypothetical protein